MALDGWRSLDRGMLNVERAQATHTSSRRRVSSPLPRGDDRIPPEEIRDLYAIRNRTGDGRVAQILYQGLTGGERSQRRKGDTREGEGRAGGPRRSRRRAVGAR